MQELNIDNGGKNIQRIWYALIIIGLIAIISTYASAVQVTGIGSSYTFTVENCTSPDNTTTFGCSPASIKYLCDIYNPAFINHVDFRIQGNDYLTTQNSTKPNQFYITYNKPAEGSTNLDPITLDRQTITDVNGHSVNSFETVFINHNCTTCPANTTRIELEPCQTNNQQEISYISSNETCLPSYNITENCNYCNADIYQNTSICDINNEQTVSYFDKNYTTCCLTTGLTEDCMIQNSPYNETTTQSCGYLQSEINCTMDTAPVLNSKINVNCILPSGNEEYCCVINTYQATNLLATSPEYKNPSNSLLTITQEEETRTCFPTTNKILNAYYTTKELRPETNYTIEILCANNQTNIKTQKQVIPEYHDYDWLTLRVKWLGDHPTFTILTIPAIILIIFLVIFVIRKIRGR